MRRTMIREVFLTTLTGMGVGAVFSIFKLPVPAPPVFAGLMGIFGLWMGYGLVQRFIS
jgi:XapX domain-containing protein